MNNERVWSLTLRIVAVVLAMAGMAGRDVSTRAAAVPPLFQSAAFIPVPNMVGYWAVDTDTGGMANNSALAPGSPAGTYSPAANPATTSTTVPAVPTSGNTKSFNFVAANNQFIDVPSTAPLSIAGSLTVSAWVRPVATTAYQMGIVEKYDEVPAVGNGYSFRLNANRVLDFSVYNGTTQGGVGTSPRLIPLNQWTHVAGVYDSTAKTMLLYHSDDDLVASPPTEGNYGPDSGDADPSQGSGINPPTVGTNTLNLGKDYGSNAFNGMVDEIRIYNRALTKDEVHVLRDGQSAPLNFAAVGGNSQNLLSWDPVTVAAGVTVTYSVVRGTTTGVYDTAYNGITGTTYTDNTNVTPGTPYFYAVVAVTVMTSGYSNEDSAIASNTPPPPPPPPRTQKLGSRHMCGCSTIMGPSWGALGALVLAASVLILPRRKR